MKKFFDLQRFQDFTNSNPNKTIKGTNENDWIENSGSIVKIYGNGGSDTVQNSGNLVTVFGGANYDSVKNTGSNVTISGDAYNDGLYNGYYWDKVNGGNSVSISSGEGNDYVHNYGGTYITLTGGIDNDTVFTCNGQYVKSFGGEGNDTLTGGKCADLFVYSNGNDTITDYTENADLIRLKGVYIKGTKASGNNAILQTDNGNITVLNGVGKTLSVITDIKVSSSSALLSENNFLTADNLSAIVGNNFAVTDYKIETQNFETLTQENLITYANK